MSTRTDGMIAVGMADHEVNEDDLYRIEDVATTGKVPANRKILSHRLATRLTGRAELRTR